MPNNKIIPANGEPVPSFNAPQHIEATWVEKVDITKSNYTQLPRGTKYTDAANKGADTTSPGAKDLIANHPNAYLLREIKSPAAWPYSYRYWGDGETFTNRSLGQDNLTPPKYRRLVTRSETFAPIDIATAFPGLLTGNQAFLEHVQETIYEARRHVVEEIIGTGGDHIREDQSDEWGPLSIFEDVVDEGTPIDEGFLVKTSHTEAFGNGKAVKISVYYPADLADRFVIEQIYDQSLDVHYKAKRYLAPSGTMIDDVRKDVKPLDIYRDEVTEWLSLPVLDSFIRSYGGTDSLDMPDKLFGVEGVIDHSLGEGADDETGSVATSGFYSVSLAVSASAQASASIAADAVPDLRQFYGNEVPCMHHEVYMTSGATYQDVLDHLNALLSASIQAKPKFNPQVVVLQTKSENESLRVTATSKGSDSLHSDGSASSTAGGTGYSIEAGVRKGRMTLSPCIHGEVILTGDTSDSRDLSASAAAEAETVGPPESISTESGFPVTVPSVEATILPTTIPATTGDTDWPAEGEFLWRVRPRPWKRNYILFICTVFDAADFPCNA